MPHGRAFHDGVDRTPHPVLGLLVVLGLTLLSPLLFDALTPLLGR